MNLSMLFEFPGILITVGVILLIVAIIVGLLAYRKVDKDDLTFKIVGEKEEEPFVMPTFETSEAVVVEEPIKEEPEQEEKIEEPSFVNEYIELDEASVSIPTIEEEKEQKPLLNQRTIYGGVSPIKDFGFKYEDNKNEEDIELL